MKLPAFFAAATLIDAIQYACEETYVQANSTHKPQHTHPDSSGHLLLPAIAAGGALGGGAAAGRCQPQPAAEQCNIESFSVTTWGCV